MVLGLVFTGNGVIRVMKLKDYIKQLEKVAEKNPNAIVICASDEEGNSFNEVHFTPTIFYYSKADQSISDVEYDGYIEAVCLN